MINAYIQHACTCGNNSDPSPEHAVYCPKWRSLESVRSAVRQSIIVDLRHKRLEKTARRRGGKRAQP